MTKFQPRNRYILIQPIKDPVAPGRIEVVENTPMGFGQVVATASDMDGVAVGAVIYFAHTAAQPIRLEANRLYGIVHEGSVVGVIPAGEVETVEWKGDAASQIVVAQPSSVVLN